MMGRGALREYLRGALWVLPTLSVLAALAAGAVLSSVSVGLRSPLAFQGTPDDARTLLLGITGTMITIIALLLGLAVVALQLSSTQFSPRLLRNFLRDRPNQVVLSAFVATFAYCAAGLYTVGVSGGNRTAAFPRLAISGALLLLFASLGLLVFFADHLLHSIQVDAIMDTVQRKTLAVIEDGLLAGDEEAPGVPAWAVPVVSRRSGYVQAVRPGTLLPCAARHGVCLRLRLRVGEHIVAGTTLAWIWRASPDDPAPDPRDLARVLEAGVRIGFERTLEQDAAFGIRQLVDVACKALSPAVNDPYTAVQRRRSPVGDLLRARPAAAGRPRRPRRLGGRDRPGPAVRGLPRGDVRAHPPLRRQRADRRARAAPAARQLRRRGRRRPRAIRGDRRTGTYHRDRCRTRSRPARGPRLHARRSRIRVPGGGQAPVPVPSAR